MRVKRPAEAFFSGFLMTFLAAAAPAPEATGYELKRAGDTWRGENPSVGLDFELHARGLRVVPRGGAAPAWTFGLDLRSVGRDGDLTTVPAAPVEMRGTRAERARLGVVEWYANDHRGIEHGLTIAASPMGRGDLLVDLNLTGSLTPQVSGDGLAVDFRGPGGTYVLRYAQLEVLDANGKTLHATMEGLPVPYGSALRIRVDDAGAVYPVEIDPMVTTAAWTGESNTTNLYYGSAVKTAGDVNGDGYSDILVAAPIFSNGETQEGMVWLYHGSPSGPGQAPAWTKEGEQVFAHFGRIVTTAGDVNGDGYDDVLIGAPERDNDQTDEGQVFLYLGSPTGLGTTPAVILEGNASNFAFGDALAAAGDVNNDGKADVLVGTSCESNGQSCEGKVRLYLGSASGLVTTPAWTAEGNQADAMFGSALSGAGDVNGDGYADVIIGAWAYSAGQQEEGAAWVYHGTSTGLSTTPAVQLEANQIYAQFGSAVDGAGDVNGDGYADVIVGVPNYTNGESSEGAAFVYHGGPSGVSSTYAWSAEGNQGPTPGFNAGTNFGGSVSTAGDVNGDGYADVVIGAANYDSPTQDEGAVFLFLGRGAVGLNATPYLTFQGDQLNSGFGRRVATAGDVNGDGYSDILAPASDYDNPEQNEGQVRVYLGAGGVPATTPSWVDFPTTATGGRMGAAVASAGDVTGDGLSDVIVASPEFSGNLTNQGKVTLYMGLPGGVPLYPVWTLQGTQLEEHFGASVAGAGDVNGDGYDDVMIASPWYSASYSHEGKVGVYLGSAAGPAASPAWTVLGQSPNASFGQSIASAGDVNGDGYADVVVAGQFGVVDLYLGSASGLSTIPVWHKTGYQGGFPYFPVVASAGDVNRDGFSDVIVTAPSASSVGKVDVYLGGPSGLASTPHWTGIGSDTFGRYGATAGTAGDVNGDGLSDVVIGAPGTRGFGTLGKVFVYLGSATGLALTPQRLITTVVPVEPDVQLVVGTAGDVDADGYSDILIGVPNGTSPLGSNGFYRIFLGSSAGTLPGPSAGTVYNNAESKFAQTAASAGDVNGDGFSDVVIGLPSLYYHGPLDGGVHLYLGGGRSGLDRAARQTTPSTDVPISIRGKSDDEAGFHIRLTGRTAAGRGKIRLEWEVKPLGAPFTGSGSGNHLTGLSDTGPPDGDGAHVYYSLNTFDLNEGTMAHWRYRNRSDNPFFPRSPWFTPLAAVATQTMLRTAGCIDRDGDGYGAIPDDSCTFAFVDCNDATETLWTAPGETGLLFYADETTIVWSPPASSGTSNQLLYDTFIGITRAGPYNTCMPSADPTATTIHDTGEPAVGTGLYYVVRARNACPNGAGSLGTTSAGVQRVGGTCP